MIEIKIQTVEFSQKPEDARWAHFCGGTVEEKEFLKKIGVNGFHGSQSPYGLWPEEDLPAAIELVAQSAHEFAVYYYTEEDERLHRASLNSIKQFCALTRNVGGEMAGYGGFA